MKRPVKLLTTIITVMILTLSFGVKSHSQINLVGLEINLFGPKRIELFGIHSRMTEKEIVGVLQEREITCIVREGKDSIRCYGKDVTDRYDLNSNNLIPMWDNEDQMVSFGGNTIVFTCHMFDGCSNVSKREVADQLVSSGVIKEYEVHTSDEDFYQGPGIDWYCYVTDPGPRQEGLCVMGSWWWGEDSLWSKPYIRMDWFNEENTPNLSFE